MNGHSAPAHPSGTGAFLRAMAARALKRDRLPSCLNFLRKCYLVHIPLAEDVTNDYIHGIRVGIGRFAKHSVICSRWPGSVRE